MFIHLEQTDVYHMTVLTATVNAQMYVIPYKEELAWHDSHPHRLTLYGLLDQITRFQTVYS